MSKIYRIKKTIVYLYDDRFVLWREDSHNAILQVSLWAAEGLLVVRKDMVEPLV
jgi:hypothetical protein